MPEIRWLPKEIKKYSKEHDSLLYSGTNIKKAF